MANWTTTFSRDAKKQYKKFEARDSRKPSIIDAIDSDKRYEFKA